MDTFLQLKIPVLEIPNFEHHQKQNLKNGQDE